MSSKQNFLQITDLSEVETMNLLDLAIKSASKRRTVSASEASLIVGGGIPINMGGTTCGMVCPDPFGSSAPLILK